MVQRTLLVLLSVLVSCCPALAQHVDPELEKKAQSVVDGLEGQAKKILPKGVAVSLRAEDGRIFSWTIELNKALVKEVGGEMGNLPVALDKWSDTLNPKIVKMTSDAVRAAGHDPLFNQETDVTVSIGGQILPKKKREGQFDDGEWYSISFTGLRRNADRDDEGKVVRAAVGDPTGGQIEVAIVPDRATWKYRETITGRLTIKNTGKQRVRFSRWWIDGVDVTDEAGNKPESFSIMGNICAAPDAVMYIFLNPGEVHTGTFSVYTDRTHSMKNGYYLKVGTWKLRYASYAIDNVRVISDPATIQVRVEAGEYTGARIKSLRCAGHNFILMREDNSVEVIDPVTGNRLGGRRGDGSMHEWMWFGSRPCFSSDGRLVAYCKDRSSPIMIESLFGDPPPRAELFPPADLMVGGGGFFAGRFSGDGSKLFCATNNAWVTMDLATGAALNKAELSEMWASISPDGNHAAAVQGSIARIVGYPGNDKFAVKIFEVGGEKIVHSVEVIGHGEYPELVMGASGAYLSDEFASSVTYVPYVEGKTRSFETGGPADVVGESDDGSLVVLSWPRAEARDEEPGATTIAVYRVSDGTKVCMIEGKEPRAAAVVSGPPRVVCLPRKFVGDGFGGGSWLTEHASIYDALTGKVIKEIDRTPKSPAPSDIPQK